MTKEKFIIEASTWLQLRMALQPFQARQIIKELVERFGEFTFEDEVRPSTETVNLMAVLAQRVMSLPGSKQIIEQKGASDDYPYLLLSKVWWIQTMKLLEKGMKRIAAAQAGKDLGQPNANPSSESSCPIIKP